MKAILVVEYDDDFNIEDILIDYTLFHNEKKVFKMYNEILKPIPKCRYYRGNERDFTDGFNACIDELLEEEE